MMFPSSSFIPAPKVRGGFTLIQLMVAIGLVAVLLLLSLGVFGTLGAKSKELQCVSNLRQWATLFQIYQGDHNGAFPLVQPFQNGVSWNALSAPLLKPLAASYTSKEWYEGRFFNGCPAHRGDPIRPDSSLSARYYSYVYNVRLGNPAIGTSYRGRLQALRDPSKLIMLADGWEGDNSIIFYDASYIGFLHQGHCNALFADGHVEQLAAVPDLLCNPNLMK